MNLLMIFIIGLHALDWSNRFKTEKYCAGKSFELSGGRIRTTRLERGRLGRRRPIKPDNQK